MAANYSIGPCIELTTAYETNSKVELSNGLRPQSVMQLFNQSHTVDAVQSTLERLLRLMQKINQHLAVQKSNILFF